MSVLIKGMEMPMGGRILIVFPSGRVLEVSADATQDIFRETQAVSVPPHGRLIDADALKQNTYEIYDPMGIIEAVPVDVIDNAPTVIEAEEDE